MIGAFCGSLLLSHLGELGCSRAWGIRVRTGVLRFQVVCCVVGFAAIWGQPSVFQIVFGNVAMQSAGCGICHHFGAVWGVMG